MIMQVTAILLSLAAGCHSISGPRILGSDLMAADPRLSGFPQSFVVGFAPAPGINRVLKASEIRRLAVSNGVDIAAPEDLCFTVPVAPMAAEKVAGALQKSLPREALFEIVGISPGLIPAGDLRFPVTGLEPPTDGVQMWRGWVLYSANRRAPVWARVRVTVPVVVVTIAVAAGGLLTPEMLRIEKRAGLNPGQLIAVSIGSAVGKSVLRAFAAGSPLQLNALTETPAVRRGDSVSVIVHSGLASLKFEAVAETSGRTGEIVALRNPSNGKTFKARLLSPVLAELDIGPGLKL